MTNWWFDRGFFSLRICQKIYQLKGPWRIVGRKTSEPCKFLFRERLLQKPSNEVISNKKSEFKMGRNFTVGENTCCKILSGNEITPYNFLVITPVKPIDKAMYYGIISPHLQVLFGPILYLKEVYILRIWKRNQLPLKGWNSGCWETYWCVSTVKVGIWNLIFVATKKTPFYIPKNSHPKDFFWLKTNGGITFWMTKTNKSYTTCVLSSSVFLTPTKTNMTMENPTIWVDVSPIKN